jgi:hypothetical protein
VIEMIVIMAAAMGITWLVLPQNPLLLGMGFPWAWLLPVILALRYGTLVGVGAVLMLLGGWFFSTRSARTVAPSRACSSWAGCCWCWWPGSSGTCGIRAWRERGP